MNAVEELIERQDINTVRQIYEAVQHCPMADIRLLGEALQEPAISITGDDATSKREQILMQGDQRLVSVLAGLKCFWMLDNTTATDIHFFDIRKDNLEIKKQMFDLFYVQHEDYNTVYDWVLNNVDGSLLVHPTAVVSSRTFDRYFNRRIETNCYGMIATSIDYSPLRLAHGL